MDTTTAPDQTTGTLATLPPPPSRLPPLRTLWYTEEAIAADCDGIHWVTDGRLCVRRSSLTAAGASAVDRLRQAPPTCGGSRALPGILRQWAGIELVPADVRGVLRAHPLTTVMVDRADPVQHVRGVSLEYHWWLIRHLRGLHRVALVGHDASRPVAYLDRAGHVLAYVMPTTLTGDLCAQARADARRLRPAPLKYAKGAKGAGTLAPTASTTPAPTLPEGVARASKAAFLRAVSAHGAGFLGAPHRQPLADVVAHCLRNDLPEQHPDPITVKGYRMRRRTSSGRESHAELDKHAVIYRCGRHVWLVWAEFPAVPGSPAHTVGLIYRTPTPAD